ncbi:MAG: hypothetical protein PHD81_00045 [Candidatus Nanoarchaeia archaeon]|nr:hypothetical protein [Candidatus Nanoarchaeia archaeon]MDD5587483.1 hypothetical protein [Candidatus Nanoarchaeia archaeon]
MVVNLKELDERLKQEKREQGIVKKIRSRLNISLRERTFLPPHFEKVDLPESGLEKRVIVEKYKGQLALIGDEHHSSYILAKINTDSGDKETYFAEMFLKKGEIKKLELNYHDLEELYIGLLSLSSPEIYFK